MLISVEDLEALEETLYWANQDRVDEQGHTVGINVVMSRLRTRQAQDER